jgi:tetratricopeptide (TPR) repeat protein
LQLEGLAYRFVPVHSSNEYQNEGHINTRVLYENVMEKFRWGNVNHPDVFLDDYNKRAIRIIQARPMFTRLAGALLKEGKTEQAEKVLDRMFELFPDEKIPLSYDSFKAAELYFELEKTDKGNEKVRQIASNSFGLLDYYLSLPPNMARVIKEEQQREMDIIQNLMVLTRRYNQTGLTGEIDQKLQKLIDRLSEMMDS